MHENSFLLTDCIKRLQTHQYCSSMESLEFTLANCKVFVSEKSTVDMLGATFYPRNLVQVIFFYKSSSLEALVENRSAVL